MLVEYKKIKLGDYITDIASGPFGSNLKVECFVPFGFPIIDGANLIETRVTDNITKFVTEEKARSLARSIAKRHDVIVTISGTLGQISYIPHNSKYSEYLCSQRQFRVTFDEDFIDVEYLVYYFHTKPGQKKILAFANYVGVPALAQPLPNFKNIVIDLPSLDYQHKVSTLLGFINDKIALNTRMNAELEAMAKQLYDYWFVQFDFPDENGKPYKSSGGKMVYNEKLKREIPEGWEVKNIFEAADVLYGYPFSTDCFIDEPTDKPVVRIRDILENSSSAFTTENVDEAYKLNEGDLVIGMDGNFHMNYWHNNECYLNQRCVRLRDIPKVPLSTIQLYYNIKPVLDHKQKLIKGSTVGHLLDSDIKEFWILLSTKDKRNTIKDQFDSLLRMITKNKNELLYLTHLRDSLLPMLMNGQVMIL